MLPTTTRPAPTRAAALVATLVALALALVSVPTAASAAAQAKPKLTISAPGSIEKGSAVTLSGTASKSGKVKLQVRYSKGGSWSTIGSKRVAKGAFSFGDKPSTDKTRWYRFTMKKKGKTATSRAAKVTVVQPAPPSHKWYDLYDMSYHASNYLDRFANLRINGAYYTKSLKATNNAGYREYNLSRLCTELTGTIGLDDDITNTGGQGQVRSRTDSNEVYKKQFGLGQAEPVTINVTNVLRIRFESNQLGDTRARGAIGSPRVYCSTAIEQGSN